MLKLLPLTIAAFFLIIASSSSAEQEALNATEWIKSKGEAYRKTENVDQAIEILKQQFEDEGLSDFIPLLSKKRIMRAIETSVAAEDKMHSKTRGPDDTDTKRYHELWSPRLNQIVKKNAWPEGSFFVLSVHTIPDWCDLVNVQLFVRSDADTHVSHTIPVLDVKFGQWLPLRADGVIADVATP